MSKYRYLQLNNTNFEFFSALLQGPCLTQMSRDNVMLGQAIVDSFITTDKYPIVSMVGASGVMWREYPEWLSDEPKWQHRHLLHNLHLGGFFCFEMNDANKVVSMTWFGYRLDLSQRGPIQVVGRQVSASELRIALKGVECSETRAQIIEDWRNLLSEDFNAKYGKL